MVRPFTPDDLIERIQLLCELLDDAVCGGASGFLPPLNPVEAFNYWDTVREALADGSRVLLAACNEDHTQILGAVQLDLCTLADGLHRAEVCNLIVHSEARESGVETALMHAVEQAARICERTLLVFDARQNSPAEELCRELAYIRAGEIPQYTRTASGQFHATVIFYKCL